MCILIKWMSSSIIVATDSVSLLSIQIFIVSDRSRVTFSINPSPSPDISLPILGKECNLVCVGATHYTHLALPFILFGVL